MGDLIYVLAGGELEIVRQSPGGSEELLKMVKPGDYFGEIGPLFNLPRSATVRARTNSTVIGYTVTAFRERLGAGGVARPHRAPPAGDGLTLAGWVCPGAHPPNVDTPEGDTSNPCTGPSAVP